MLIPILWVFVHDLTGTHRDTYLFTTDLSMTVSRIIETYTGRWNIETTFQELRGVPRSGDNAGLEPEHSAAGCSMPVRHVYGGGVVVRRVAGAVHASAGGGLAWQTRCNVLGRDHGGSTLVVGRVGFCNPRSSRSLFKTQGPIPANRAQWASPGTLRPPDGPLPEAREGILRLSQRDLAIELRRGTRGENGQVSSVIPVEKADHEPDLVVSGVRMQGLVERHVLLRRAVDDVTAGGESQPLGGLADFHEYIRLPVTVEVLGEPPQETVDV